jgi:cytochrome c biogenesis protein ResB
MGFALYCDDFDTAFFPKTRIPSHYISTITARQDGNAIASGPVEVNHSLIVNGWTLHQTSYQEIDSPPRYKVSVTPPGAEEPIETELSVGQVRALPVASGSNIQIGLGAGLMWKVFENDQAIADGTLGVGSGGAVMVKPVRFEPDFVMDANNQIGSRSQNLNNPALRIELLNANGASMAGQWLFGREDMKAMMHATAGTYEFELKKVEGEAQNRTFVIGVVDSSTNVALNDLRLKLNESATVGGAAANMDEGEEAATDVAGWNVELVERVQAYATILTLTRNPVFPFIYAGCVIMLLGLLISFFVRWRKVWFTVDPGAGRLYVAGVYRHATMELDKATLAAMKDLEKIKSVEVEELEEAGISS